MKRILGRRSPEHGFTLIELLVVVAIIGLIAVVAMPNLTNAIDKSRQTSTKANISAIGHAIEAYQIENMIYPEYGDTGSLEEVGMRLADTLYPKFLSKKVADDGWGKPLRYGAKEGHYTLRSYGKNGIMDSTTGGSPKSFDADIVWIDNGFVQEPQGG